MSYFEHNNILFLFEGRIFADSCDGNQVLSGFCLFGYTFAFMRAKIQFPIREFARKVLLPISLVTALSVIPTAILSYLDLAGWKYLIASVLTFMAFYMTSVFFIGISRSERERVMVLLKRKQTVS